MASPRSYIVNITIRIGFCHCDHFWADAGFVVNFRSMSASPRTRTVRVCTKAQNICCWSLNIQSFVFFQLRVAKTFFSGNLLKMQILRPHRRPSVSAALGVGPAICQGFPRYLGILMSSKSLRLAKLRPCYSKCGCSEPKNFLTMQNARTFPRMTE